MNTKEIPISMGIALVTLVKQGITKKWIVN